MLQKFALTGTESDSISLSDDEEIHVIFAVIAAQSITYSRNFFITTLETILALLGGYKLYVPPPGHISASQEVGAFNQ